MKSILISEKQTGNFEINFDWGTFKIEDFYFKEIPSPIIRLKKEKEVIIEESKVKDENENKPAVSGDFDSLGLVKLQFPFLN